ncbi:MAG: nitroreductase [Clostridiales bacterium]|nr:nitroreductase [Clostridiales bacterium]
MNQTTKDLCLRRSIRAYQDKQVPKDVLETVLEAGIYAPSGSGRQPLRLVVVQDKALLGELSKMNAAVMGKDTDPFYGAPTAVLVFADKNISTYFADGSLVMGNLFNAAFAEGLGSCWINRGKEMFQTDEGKALMAGWGVGDSFEGIGICILGYAACDLPEAAPRKEGLIIWA